MALPDTNPEDHGQLFGDRIGRMQTMGRTVEVHSCGLWNTFGIQENQQDVNAPLVVERIQPAPFQVAKQTIDIPQLPNVEKLVEIFLKSSMQEGDRGHPTDANSGEDRRTLPHPAGCWKHSREATAADCGKHRRADVESAAVVQ